MPSTSHSSKRVVVPGSTSNLGPGFDCVGLALGLYLEAVLVEPNDEPGHAYLERRGTAASWPLEGDLFTRAFDLALGAKPGEAGFRFRVHSELPLERGIGSSGAATAAGLLLGAAVARERGGPAKDVKALLGLGLELEGHPDNVTASLLGGLTLCAPLDVGPEKFAVLTPEVHTSLGVVLAWSEHRSPTERARAVLPTSVPFADAVENPRRLALLLAALRAGDATLLASGSVDRLHERYRLELIPGGSETLAAMRAAGAPLATVSGSGSALVAVAPHDRLEAIAKRAQATLSRFAEGVVARPVSIERTAPSVSPAI